MEEQEGHRYACFVCEEPFTPRRRRSIDGRNAPMEIWADGERILMLCRVCVPTVEERSLIPGFEVSDLGSEDMPEHS